MADVKRPAGAERVATPRTSNQQQSSDSHKDLTGAIGARIKIVTTEQTLEGTLFTTCPIFNVVAINTTLASLTSTSDPLAEPGDYHIIPISKIQSFQVIQLSAGANKDGTGAVSPISKVDTAKLKDREQARIKKLKEEEKKRGKGVTAEAQALFNALDRMYSVRWHNQDIIVDDAVIVSSPYTSETCKAPKEKQQSLTHIRKVVDGEKKKFAEKSRQASPLPRKGG